MQNVKGPSVDTLRALENTPNSYLILSPDLYILTASDRYLEATATKREVIVGKQIFEAFPDNPESPEADSVKKINDSLQQVLRTKRPHQTALQKYDVPDNQHPGKFIVKYWDGSHTPVLDDQGEISYIIQLANDVTEQVLKAQQLEISHLNESIAASENDALTVVQQHLKETISQLAESEARIHHIISSAPFPIAVYTGREMKIEFANQAILDVWGKGNDVIGHLYAEVLPELDNQAVFDQLDAVFTTGTPFHARNQQIDLVVNGNLQVFYFNYSFTPLLDASGQIYGVMNTAADVTDAVLARNLLEHSEEELQTTNEELAAANEELSAVNEEMTASNEELVSAQENINAVNDSLVLTEARLRGLLKQATAGIMICNGPELVIESVNDMMLEIISKSTDIVGKKFTDALPELGEQGLFEVINQVHRSGETFVANEAKVAVERNGRLIDGYFNFSYQAIVAPSGETSGILIVATDVTQQVDAKKYLKLAEETLRSSVVAADIGTYAINASTRTLIANPRLKELFGYYPDEEMPYDAAILQITDEYRQEVIDKVEAAFIKGEPFFAEYTIVGFHDQRLRWVRSVGKYDDQAVEGDGYFSGAIIDITEQVNTREAVGRLNQAVINSREELLFAIDAAALGTWDLNPATSTFKGNDLLKSWFGLQPEEEISLYSATDVIAPPDRERVIAAIGQSLDPKSGGYYDAVYTIINPNDPTPRIVRAMGKAVFNEQGEPIRLSGTLQDITEQKANEQRKNDFIGMVSHELKTPLTSLTAIIQVTNAKLKNSPDEFLSGAMEKANVQVKRMSNMINGFLNISRLESGKIQIIKEDFSLDELLLEVEKEHTLTVSTHIIHTRICGHVSVHADRDKIHSVISNLLSNAVKYSPKEKNITVSCDIDGKMTRVSIKDEGMGILPADSEKIFDRYYRVEADQNKHISGFGIGLYLSAEIIRQHGGEIWVDSEPDNGSTFNFTLPL